jgi:hypothetical protein
MREWVCAFAESMALHMFVHATAHSQTRIAPLGGQLMSPETAAAPPKPTIVHTLYQRLRQACDLTGREIKEPAGFDRAGVGKDGLQQLWSGPAFVRVEGHGTLS